VHVNRVPTDLESRVEIINMGRVEEIQNIIIIIIKQENNEWRIVKD